MADPGDEVRVASGTYTDLHARPRADVVATGLVTQVLYLDKTLTVRGGYTTTGWDAPDPVAHPTTLDAQGQGRGIYVTGTDSTVALTNTILVSHTVGITVAAGNTATLEATLWGSGAWANQADWGGPGTLLASTIHLWGDPAFVDPGAGDYHIAAQSAAIDAGIPMRVSHDIDGEPRPLFKLYDLGADEFPLRLVLLPLVWHGFGP